MAAVSCGIDWAQDHHDVAVVDEHGAVVCAERIGNDAAGLARLLEILVEHDPADRRLEVAIETSRGLLVAGLRAAGRTVFAINPLAVSRYRDRYRSSRGKSDTFGAMVLANILRTDRNAHRPLPDDSEQVRVLQVLCRAQQDAVWDKITITNRIRALLKAYFPGAVAAFERGGKHRLESASCRTILAAASTPGEAAALTERRLAVLLRKAGRKRGIDAEAARLHDYFHNEQMHQPEAVEQAMGVALRGLVRQLDAICDALAELETLIDAAFLAHPDGRIISSVPGLGVALGARLLTEIGDDHTRFAAGRALKAFAGAAPVTRASGRSTFVHARRAKNNRMAAVGYVWALAAVRHDPLWEARYRARRAAGDRHVTALRKMFNSMPGKLHHCLTTGELYQPDEAFRPHLPAAEAPAA
ncbi:IS110 family transposase [Pseudonocardia asaccharolytica]|uniref:Mini-circle putative transposase for IS117 n=1 Tax=Pseudonocardia asaccharolytica DSM 44247 = NBRC 16224 TaxID=1123024 RepID=A0A511DD93_9PSEU|nr:IS110 family transposase [Pseudonocardia asaccharolytica]GEL20938.1 mini-circle putative transposase for IS117 [Pseudonocardia asaccharolytica DSM 44247 = NBRC 16224]